MDLLGCVCTGLVKHPLLPLAISFESVALVFVHSSCHCMTEIHCRQNSFCSLQELPALLLLLVDLGPPLDTLPSPPDQVSFCKVPDSWPFPLAHEFPNASQMVFQSDLLST